MLVQTTSDGRAIDTYWCKNEQGNMHRAICGGSNELQVGIGNENVGCGPCIANGIGSIRVDTVCLVCLQSHS